MAFLCFQPGRYESAEVGKLFEPIAPFDRLGAERGHQQCVDPTNIGDEAAGIQQTVMADRVVNADLEVAKNWCRGNGLPVGDRTRWAIGRRYWWGVRRLRCLYARLRRRFRGRSRPGRQGRSRRTAVPLGEWAR